jgi:hypothetical protein
LHGRILGNSAKNVFVRDQVCTDFAFALGIKITDRSHWVEAGSLDLLAESAKQTCRLCLNPLQFLAFGLVHCHGSWEKIENIKQPCFCDSWHKTL